MFLNIILVQTLEFQLKSPQEASGIKFPWL
jgi:hypothetical protein